MTRVPHEPLGRGYPSALDAHSCDQRNDVAPMFQIVCGQSSKLVMARAFCPIGITDAALQRQERHRGAHDTPKHDGTTDQGA
jgi:hypothetical protein